MATRDGNEKDLLELGLELLADEEAGSDAEREAVFETIGDRLDQPGLQDAILQRYADFGRQLLTADSLASAVDPRIAKSLEPMLGDVSDVRIHTGPAAAAAARAMDARAFALGDRDIFLDPQQLGSDRREAGALIAHEIAHTRDAATGFALSAKHGHDTSAREEYAHEVAHQFAREWELEDGDESMIRDEGEPSAITTPSGMPGDPEIDRHELAEKVVKILESQQRMYSDRTGRW